MKVEDLVELDYYEIVKAGHFVHEIGKPMTLTGTGRLATAGIVRYDHASEHGHLFHILTDDPNLKRHCILLIDDQIRDDHVKWHSKGNEK
jgi:hypothetical protein